MAAATSTPIVAHRWWTGLGTGLLVALGLALAPVAPAQAAPAKKSSTKASPAKKAAPKARTGSHKATAAAAAATAPVHAKAGSADVLMPLPAVFRGTLALNCPDCTAGTAYTLRLHNTGGEASRGSYELHRQAVNSLAQTPLESGPWRLSYDFGRLILGGSSLPTLYAIKDRSTLVQLGIDGKPLDGGHNQLQRVLTSDGSPAVAPDHPTMTSAPPASTGTGTLESTFWRLVQLGNTAVAPSGDPQRDPHLVLQPGEQRITGSGGCNRFAGSFERPGADALRLSGIVSTRMACAENDKTLQEALFFDALNQTRRYQLAGKRLELRGENGGVLAVLEMH